ncbi:hypothetical protein AMJ80_11245 [bacterium SM23_31]|nr:MAG: hypothetical protein AMJ80_11245 [bacterium SM23_31]
MIIKCKHCRGSGILSCKKIHLLHRSFGLLRRLTVIFWMLLLVSGCSSNIPYTNTPDETEDNLKRFNTVLRTIFQLIDTGLEPDKPVYFLESSDRTSEQRFIENTFQEYISIQNREVFLIAEDYLQKVLLEKQSGYIVSFQVQKMKVEYTAAGGEEKNNKKLFRNIEVQVSCNVINRMDGAVVLARTFSENLKDNISPDVINYIQNPALTFTIAELPKQKRFRDLFELGTVLTAAGTIIYLLFSTRS